MNSELRVLSREDSDVFDNDDVKYDMFNGIKNFIESKDFPNSINIMKLITAPTGFGKSYVMRKNLVPFLMKERGLQVLYVTYPDTAIFTSFEKKDMASKSGAILCENMNEVIEYLEEDEDIKIIYTAHNCNFTTLRDLEKIKKYTSNMGIIVDEAHSWMTSNVDNYKSNTGNATPEYSARLYKWCEEVASISPYVFGFTATASPEQDDEYAGGKLSVMGGLDFKIISEWPHLNHIIERISYFDTVNFYDPTDEEETVEAFHHYLSDVQDCYFKKPYKKTSLLYAAPEHDKLGHNIQWILSEAAEWIKENKHYNEDNINDHFTILTSEFRGFLTYKAKGFSNKGWEVESADEQEILKALNDENHPALHCILIGKGQVGINVHTNKYQFSLRTTEKVREAEYGGGGIYGSTVQRWGRMLRFNLGENAHKFEKEYKYSLSTYIKSLTDAEYEMFLEANTWNAVVPDTHMARTAHDQLMDKQYCASIAQARSYLDNLRV